MIPNWSTRTVKQQITYPLIFDRPFQSVLSLSGGQCADLQYALKTKQISRATMIDVIERDAATARQSKLSLQSLGFKHANVFTGELYAFEPSVSYDLLNIDLLGNLNFKDLVWLAKQRSRVMEGASMSLTMYPALRSNTFIPTMYALMKDANCPFLETLESHWGNWVPAVTHLLIGEFVLAGYDYQTKFKAYNDKTDMMLLVYKNIRRTLTERRGRLEAHQKIQQIIQRLEKP